MTGALFLSGEDIADLAQQIGIDSLMDDLIDRITSDFKDFEAGKYEIPSRAGLHHDGDDAGLTEWMPLVERDGKILIKLVGYHPENPTRRGLPTILSTISVLNRESGRLEVIMDGTILTAMRTGAASAVASRVLARPDSRTLGLLGCGAQAVTQLHAISRVFDIQEVLLFDTDPEAANSLGTRIRQLGIDPAIIRVCSLEQVVSESDILCVATSVDIGCGPIFDPAIPTKPWLHVNAVGSDFKGKTELPVELLRDSFVCPDFLNQAEVEGECQQLDSGEIGPELIHVMQNAGDYEEVKNRRSVFDSTGFALEDYIAMTLFHELACRLGKGIQLEIESVPRDPKNPYEFLSSGVSTAVGNLDSRKTATAVS